MWTCSKRRDQVNDCQLKTGSLHLNPKARRHRPVDGGPLVRNVQRFTQRTFESLQLPTLIGNVLVKRVSCVLRSVLHLLDRSIHHGGDIHRHKREEGAFLRRLKSDGLLRIYYEGS